MNFKILIFNFLISLILEQNSTAATSSEVHLLSTGIVQSSERAAGLENPASLTNFEGKSFYYEHALGFSDPSGSAVDYLGFHKAEEKKKGIAFGFTNSVVITSGYFAYARALGPLKLGVNGVVSFLDSSPTFTLGALYPIKTGLGFGLVLYNFLNGTRQFSVGLSARFFSIIQLEGDLIIGTGGSMGLSSTIVTVQALFDIHPRFKAKLGTTMGVLPSFTVPGLLDISVGLEFLPFNFLGIFVAYQPGFETFRLEMFTAGVQVRY